MQPLCSVAPPVTHWCNLSVRSQTVSLILFVHALLIIHHTDLSLTWFLLKIVHRMWDASSLECSYIVQDSTPYPGVCEDSYYVCICSGLSRLIWLTYTYLITLFRLSLETYLTSSPVDGGTRLRPYEEMGHGNVRVNRDRPLSNNPKIGMTCITTNLMRSNKGMPWLIY